LGDVIDLLCRRPYTRQATLPIFFPEDTGAKHGGRIPCTLHYHFMLRNGKLHMWYPIRSCDAVRHFRDDVYMAMRLCQWVLSELREKEQVWVDVDPGVLSFTAYSFHAHMGDWHLLEEGIA
jgi:thymidylate synthase